MMNTIMVLNGVLAILCFVIAGCEATLGTWGASIAYIGFGIGYTGLTMLYGGA